MIYDKISIQRIDKLHPLIRLEVLQLFKKCYDILGVPIRIVQGLRTPAEQDALYAQGRTKPGPIVTNAKAWQSNHNYGLSFDFCLLINDGTNVSWDTKADFDRDGQRDWWEVINLFKAAGYEAGADWKSFQDLPHIQKTFGKTVTQLRALVRAGKVSKQGYVLI